VIAPRHRLVIFDFGQDVGGKVQVKVTGTSAVPPGLHASFSESRQYQALPPGDHNGETAFAPGSDAANIWVGPNFPGFPYTYDADSHILPLGGAPFPKVLEDPQLRGGFRYLTLFLDAPGYVEITGLALNFTAAPKQADLRDYKGWFLCNDHLLNKVWYAGAYTVQLNTGRGSRRRARRACLKLP
jgi:hypothetical protein